MNGTILLAVATSFSALSLGIAVLSLVFHWVRRSEHPDVARVTSQVQELSLAHADLVDKVTHWQRRDRVRNLREGKQKQEDQDQALAGLDPKAFKANLRAKVFGLPSAVNHD